MAAELLPSRSTRPSSSLVAVRIASPGVCRSLTSPVPGLSNAAPAVSTPDPPIAPTTSTPPSSRPTVRASEQSSEPMVASVSVAGSKTCGYTRTRPSMSRVGENLALGRPKDTPATRTRSTGRATPSARRRPRRTRMNAAAGCRRARTCRRAARAGPPGGRPPPAAERPRGGRRGPQTPGACHGRASWHRCRRASRPPNARRRRRRGLRTSWAQASSSSFRRRSSSRARRLRTPEADRPA